MKYYLEEITTLKDGKTAVSITEKESKDIAISTLHRAMASAIVNEDVVRIHVEAKDDKGFIFKVDNYAREMFVPEQIVVEEVTE